MSWFTLEMWLVALAITIVLLGGFSTFARWCILGSAVPKRKLNALQIGMSQQDIRSLLGEPREKRPGEKEHEFWIFGSRFKRYLLVIEFDATGRLKEFVHAIPHHKGAGKTHE
jgi:outer membrane protein assembly factor BamE (lipoprotein component of BamABCDE complex)